MENSFSTRVKKLNPKKVNIFNVRTYIGIVKELIEYIRKESQRLQKEKNDFYNERIKLESEIHEKDIYLSQKSQGLDKREANIIDKETEIAELRKRLQQIEAEYQDKINGDSKSEGLPTKLTETQRHNAEYLKELFSICNSFNLAINEITESTGTAIDPEEDIKSTKKLLLIEGQLLAVLEMKRKLWSIENPIGYKQLSDLISKRLNEAIRDCEVHNDSVELGLIEAFVNTIAVQFDWLLYHKGIYTYESNINQYCFNNKAISQSVKKLINCPDTYKANLEGVVQALLDSEYFVYTCNRKDVYKPIGSAQITEHIQFMINRGIISRQDGDSSKIGYEEKRQNYWRVQEGVKD